MKKLIKWVYTISCIFLMLMVFCVNASALEFGGIPVLQELELPDDLDFSVSDTCSDHMFFMQASAREDGYFLIYSRHTDLTGDSNDTFKRVYIDIYDSEGVFLQELSFVSPLDLAVEITEESVNMYFYSSVMVYDLETQELTCYAISDGAAVNGGLYQTLREDEFVCGDWQYRCIKSFDGYTQLVRSNNDQEQVLVKMPGTGNSFFNTFFPGIIAGVLLLAVSVIFLINKKGINQRFSNIQKSWKSHILVIFIVTLCITFPIVFLAKYKAYFGRRPVDQPCTTWVSEDQTITIYVDENQHGSGTITQGNDTIHFILTNGPSIEIELYPLEALDGILIRSELRYEEWSGDFIRDDHFIATVQETTFFTVGDEIAFYRVND